MKVKVVTAEDGVRTFDAASWEKDYDGGLVVYAANGEQVAEFSADSWHLVFTVKEEE